MNWPISTIGELCAIVSGATPKTGNLNYWDGDIPWVTPKDLSELSQKYLSDTSRKITEAGLQSCSTRMLPARSVLLSSRAPIGLVAINTLPVCTNQGFKSMVPRDGCIAPDYLYWWLKTHREALEHKGRGATFKEVSKKIVEEIAIPLPPVAEQTRIAGILDAADALRVKRREALALLDTLLQSTFLDLFGDPVTNPKGWDRRALGEVIRVKSGDGLVSKDMAPDGEYPVYGGNGINGYHDSFMFEEPRIVMGRVGVYCGAVHLTRPRAWVTDNALYVHTLFQPVHTAYLVAALKMANLNQYASQSAQPLISGTRIYPVQILVPPLDLQHRFAAVVESVEQQKACQQAHLAELNTLFASLQSRAFRGDL